MEQNNPNLPPTTFCRSGCGFYGNDSFEGLCSKCYKDQLKRKQQSSSPVSPAGRSSPATSLSPASSLSPAGEDAAVTTVSLSLSKTNLGNTVPVNDAGSNTSISRGSTTPSVETGSPTIPVTSAADKDKVEGASGGTEGSDNGADTSKDKKKRSRCHTCKKKVGLTGFECRCGGLFCSLHRYSDKHDCTFNYREMAQEQIRKNNPVIVGEKIQKI
ncbi:AN1-type zinc finger protein 6-like isoform X1 [Mya arenaria]|uniref:AN1-type zinc finger protein 6-like isoform X1 n=1 Tax=Mya arenaria TaxID=6604 RepID=UPI0022E5E3CC|nr:AN1-type zinc finger protein 6-like isoform X1 [Mya arenaria]XP_052812940.1 AN1-type zinc finger protein 6-like isoform X1 [Mya arenaria]